MSEHLLSHGSTRSTPQRQPVPGRDDQIVNDEAGYVFDVGMWGRFKRFLILGSEGGSFYATERKLTVDNVQCVHACVKEDGVRAVREIVEISESGRAPQNDAALWALAVAISHGDKLTKSAAAEALPNVARIGTHLYHFVAYAETMRGWGRTLKWAITNWYSRNPEQLAFQAVKYRQRDGWSHRDLLRLAHANPNDTTSPVEHDALFHWITKGELKPRPTVETAMEREPIVQDGVTYYPDTADLPFEGIDDPFKMIEGFEKAQNAISPVETALFVRQYGLPREALLTEHLKDPDVWRAMLETKMPLGAMTRNLANMTRYGILNEQQSLASVVNDLTNADLVKKSRLHPMALLVALRTYASGRGMRGSNTWTPIPDVLDALDEAFHLAFANVEPTGKNILLGVDISGSMNHPGVAGSPLTARDCAIAMAVVTLHAERNCRTLAFTDRLRPLAYSRRQRLDDAIAQTPRTGEGTDCSLPIIAAVNDLKSGKTGDFLWDAIVLYTDNQTWSGRTAHVHQAINQYRQLSGKQTRLIVCGLVADQFTVADPNDPLSLNVVGFDTSTPALLSEFAAGKL